MARLTAAQRRRLPKSAFAYPSTRSYPIHDRPHARAALRLSARKSTKGSYAHVRKKVAKKFPGLVGKKKSTKTRRKATSRRRRTTRRRRR